MKLAMCGCGAVGECIVKTLLARDPKGEWLDRIFILDVDGKRPSQLLSKRVFFVKFDISKKDSLISLFKEKEIDFVMDAAPPYLSSIIFDAAYEAGCNYGNMGTYSIPKENPVYEEGFDGCYEVPMCKHVFDTHNNWVKSNQMAVICMGIDPGVVNVMAKYAATELFDNLDEVRVYDSGDIKSSNDDIVFGFNPWTVFDEVMNPNAEYDVHKGGFILEPPFSGQISKTLPIVGDCTLVKVEHEEVVTLPKYLKTFGLKKASFRIALDEKLITALKVLDELGLNSTKPVTVPQYTEQIIPRDVIAACVPQPKDIGEVIFGTMVVGVHCFGEINGEKAQRFIYNDFTNEESMERYGIQAVAGQTGLGAALMIELIAKGIWNEPGVYSPEYFEAKPFIDLAKEEGYRIQVTEL